MLVAPPLPDEPTMPQPTFLEDLMSAGRGVFGLLVGDKRSAGAFDYTQRGLVSAAIAFLIVVALGIYLPMIPEAAITMLACARIGATHSVVFGGFSAEALRDRMNDAEASVLVTAVWAPTTSLLSRDVSAPVGVRVKNATGIR